MSLGQWVFNQKRLFIILTTLLSIMGVLSLVAVPKDEDPRLPNWFATISIVLPGGDADQIDEMISKPLNDRLKEIDEIKLVETTSRSEIVIFQLEMKDSVRNTTEVWDKVRNTLNETKIDFPAGTLEPTLTENANTLETILLVVHGEEDLLTLKKTALELKQSLISLPGTSKIVLHGDPDDEIQINYSNQKLENLSISHGQIIQRLKQANTGIPAGSLAINGKEVPILIPSRIREAKNVENLRLLRGNGETIDLSQLANIKKSERRFQNGAYWNAKPALYLGIVAQPSIEIIKYGENVRQKIEAFKKNHLNKKIEISEVSFNPDRTQERLKDLGLNLLIGVLTVGLILCFWINWQTALVVSVFLPAISLVGFFIYSSTGGVLHQISLAAFVISLGQFIDNIIVIVEYIDVKVSQGMAPSQAAQQAIDSFKKPMLFATGTNISAFLPMLASQGSTAEFTFAIPLVSIITLIAAWVLAFFVSPIFAAFLLSFKKPVVANERLESKSKKTYAFANLITNRPYLFLSLSFVAMLMSSIGFLFVKKQFFPNADRNQLVLEFELQEDSNAKVTFEKFKKLESFVGSLPEVKNYASFVGEQIPRFYYNIGMEQWGSHTAKIIITTHEKKLNNAVILKVKEFSEANLKDQFVITKNLEQGPPILAPIEFKIFSEDSAKLRTTVAEIENLVKANDQVISSKTDIGVLQTKVNLELKKDLAERFSINEEYLGMTVLSATDGLITGKYFDDGKLKNIKLIGPEISTANELENTPVLSTSYRSLRIKDVTNITYRQGPSVIHRLNGEKLARVLAWPKATSTPDQIVQKLSPAVEEVGQKNETRITNGGDSEGAGEANMAIIKTIPLGLFTLILFLLLEFNSVRKMLIILFSVPFVIAGVTPGLIIGDAAFGFMSLLGVLALVGIVVNNSILLIESIDEHREQSFELKLAIVEALKTRTRPILITAVTTIASLLPMAFEESTLWPPLAWAMITGLIGSTVITLVFVPSFYLILFGERKKINLKLNTASVKALSLLLISFMIFKPENSEAKVYSLKEILKQVESSSSSLQASSAQLEYVQNLEKTQSRAAFMPKLGLTTEMKEQNHQLTQTNGFGTFSYGKTKQVTGGVELTQPLLNLEEMSGESSKIENLSEAEKQRYQAELQNTKKTLIAYLTELKKIKFSISSFKTLEASLLKIEKEALKFQKLGLRGRSDLLGVQIALSENRSEQLRLNNLKNTLLSTIQSYIQDFEDIENFVEPETSTTQAATLRPEIKALQFQLESEKEGLSALKKGHLPTLDLKLRHLYSDQGLLDQKNWNEAALVLNWKIFEGGTRSSRIAAQAALANKAEHNLRFYKDQIEIEKTQTQSAMQEVDYNLKEVVNNIESAKLALAEDKRNSLAGKIPIKDWMQSEILLEQKKLKYEMLKLDKVKLQYDYLFVNGVQIN
jgi:multidrug efflux pump subunit AcrB/outer membrane protein TolC